MHDPETTLLGNYLLARAESSLYCMEQTLLRIASWKRSRFGRGLNAQELNYDEMWIYRLGLPRNESLFRSSLNAWDRIDLEALEVLRTTLLEVETDPKFDKLLRFLEGDEVPMSCAQPPRVIVVTSFSDTAAYLYSSLKDRNRKVIRLRLTRDNSEELHCFRDTGVLVATSSSLKMIPTLKVDVVVHYDLPASTEEMSLRKSRTLLCGTHESNGHYLFLDRQDALPHEKMLTKLYTGKTPGLEYIEEVETLIQGKTEHNPGERPQWTTLLLRAIPLLRVLYELKSRNLLSSAVSVYLDDALEYFFSPLDLIPEDRFGLKGYLDDLALAALTVLFVREQGFSEQLLVAWKDLGMGDDPFTLAQDTVDGIHPLIEAEFPGVWPQLLRFLPR